MTTPTKEDIEKAERLQVCGYCGGSGSLAEQVAEGEVGQVQCGYCYSTGDAYSDRTKDTFAQLLADEREKVWRKAKKITRDAATYCVCLGYEELSSTDMTNPTKDEIERAKEIIGKWGYEERCWWEPIAQALADHGQQREDKAKLLGRKQGLCIALTKFNEFGSKTKIFESINREIDGLDESLRISTEPK